MYNMFDTTSTYFPAPVWTRCGAVGGVDGAVTLCVAAGWWPLSLAWLSSLLLLRHPHLHPAPGVCNGKLGISSELMCYLCIYLLDINKIIIIYGIDKTIFMYGTDRMEKL